MSEKRVILAMDSRLVREMLNRILLKANNLKVVQEITNFSDLPSALENVDAEWVIMSLPFDNKVPGWVEMYMNMHPHVRFLAVSTDGSEVKIKWLESREKDFVDLSLEDLIHILEGEAQHLFG